MAHLKQQINWNYITLKWWMFMWIGCFWCHYFYWSGWKINLKYFETTATILKCNSFFQYYLWIIFYFCFFYSLHLARLPYFWFFEKNNSGQEKKNKLETTHEIRIKEFKYFAVSRTLRRRKKHFSFFGKCYEKQGYFGLT